MMWCDVKSLILRQRQKTNERDIAKNIRKCDKHICDYLWLIDGLGDPFVQNLQDTVYPKT